MSSWQSQVIRVFLRIQKIAQRSATIASTRRWGNRIEGFYSLPKEIGWEQVAQGDFIHEWLIPKEIRSPALIFYIHGGGFVFPLWNPGRRAIAHLAQSAGMRTFMVAYRLAPEHPFPAAIEDCVSAYRWFIEETGISPKQVIFVGESAGGNLVLTTMLALRSAGQPLPSSAVAICPVFDFEGQGTFYTAADPMAHAGFVMRQLKAYQGSADPHHPLLSPLYADLQGLPPLLIQVGEAELLRSGAEALAARAQQAGVSVTLEIWPRMWHFWHLFALFLPEAREATGSIVRFIHSFAQGE